MQSLQSYGSDVLPFPMICATTHSTMRQTVMVMFGVLTAPSTALAALGDWFLLMVPLNGAFIEMQLFIFCSGTRQPSGHQATTQCMSSSPTRAQPYTAYGKEGLKHASTD
jgi:hypothetical protein